MSSPEISVIVPVYNRTDFLDEVVASVLSQGAAVDRCEILLVDDGSIPALNEIWNHPDPRVQILTKPHAGVSEARNHGIKQARGAILAFLDSDDLWLPGKLEHQWQIMRDHPDVGLSHTNLLIVDEVGETINPGYLPFDRSFLILPPRSPLTETVKGAMSCITSTVMVRKDVAQTVGSFDPEMHVTEDLDFFVRAISEAGLAYVPIVGTAYRRHEGGLHYREDWVIAGLTRGLEKLGTYPAKDGTDRRRAVNFVRWTLAGSFGLGQLRRGHRQAARRFFRELVRARPFNPTGYIWWLLAATPLLPGLLVWLVDAWRTRSTARSNGASSHPGGQGI